MKNDIYIIIIVYQRLISGHMVEWAIYSQKNGYIRIGYTEFGSELEFIVLIFSSCI